MRRNVAFNFLLVFLICFSGYAQSVTSGVVSGTVTDPSGAAVAHAAVTLTNINTNAAQQSTTNADGGYTFSFVQPGTYKVAVTAQGFAPIEHTGITVSAGQPSAANVQLSVATASNAGSAGSICRTATRWRLRLPTQHILAFCWSGGGRKASPRFVTC